MAASKKPVRKAAAKKPASKTTPTGVVFDIAHPKKGALNTSSTTRPVLITNRPLIQDDVVNEKVVVEPMTAPVLTRPKKVVIVPLDESVSKVSVNTEQPVAEAPATPEPIAPAEPEPAPEPTPEPETKLEPAAPTPKPAPIDPKPAITTAAGKPIEDLLPQQPVAVPAAKRDDKQLSPGQVEEALRLSQERAARLQHIIEEEQFFLPINAVQQRRSRNFAILGLVLVILLAAAWYDTALDANLVPNSFNLPHTSFFSVK